MGVSKQVLSEGDSSTYPKKGDKVTVHYTGRLQSNKTVFDSSHNRKQPFSCKVGVGQVIKGWDEGLLQMSLGEKAVLSISEDYAYGARGVPGVIPPSSALSFEVELLAINDKSKYSKMI